MGGGAQNASIFTYETLVHAISGAAGSVVAMATFFPLDTVRSRLQLEEGRESKSTLATIRELTEKEGVCTLYRGMVPVLQSLCASNFVYFYTFHGLKILLSRRNQSAGNDLLFASIAGVINVLTTTPLWVVNTRLKMKGIEQAQERNNNEYNTLCEGLLHIWKYEGIRKLWAGTLPSLVLVSNPAIQFMTYETIKRNVTASLRNSQPPAWMFFAIGAIAKAISTVLTYPLQLVQTKLRHGHKYSNLSPDAGTLEILFYILKKQGVGALYKGMEAKLLQTILTAALMFLAYEKISRFVFRILLHRPSQFNLNPVDPTSPDSQLRKVNSTWNDKPIERVNSVDRHSLALKKIERKSTRAIVKFWKKLKPRKNSRKQLEPVSSESLIPVWNVSHVEEKMSARSQRGVHDTIAKRLPTPRVNQENRAPKSPITYDYDAAISQPDVPNFLDLKKAGRGAMVSGVPLKKRALKTRVRCGIMSRKNFQKRSQTFRPKSAVQKHAKARSLDCKNYAKETIASSDISDEERGVVEKENVTNNSAKDIDDSSVLRKNSETANERNVSYKETISDNQITGRNVKNERQEDCDSIAAKSSVLQAKGSKIPLAKTTAFPVHATQEFHSQKKPGNRVKNTTCLNCTSINCAPNVEVSEREIHRIAGKIQERSCKQDVVRFEEFQKNAKIWNGEESSTTKAEEETEEDRGLTSTDDSPAISNIDDPRVMTILRSLKLNCPCKSCSNQDHEPLSSSRQEDDSDLKSSSPDKSRKKRWLEPLKHRKYIETSSEDVDVSSDGKNENDKKKKRDRLKTKNLLIQQTKTNSIVNASPKISNRRSNFSFLNTLFDIVFWPYLFLKTNR